MALTAAAAARLRAATPLWQRAQTGLDALPGSHRVAALHMLADASLAALRDKEAA